MQNIFEEGCLLRLSISTWSGVKKLDPAVMEQVGESDWLKGRKHLIDPEYLSPIKATAQKARCLVKKKALPFPMPGLNLVPKESIISIENQLEDIKHEFNSNVRLFLRNYASAREEAQQALGSLFDSLDYPIDPSEKFSIPMWLQGATPETPKGLVDQVTEQLFNLGLGSRYTEYETYIQEKYGVSLQHLSAVQLQVQLQNLQKCEADEELYQKFCEYLAGKAA